MRSHIEAQLLIDIDGWISPCCVLFCIFLFSGFLVGQTVSFRILMCVKSVPSLAHGGMVICCTRLERVV